MISKPCLKVVENVFNVFPSLDKLKFSPAPLLYPGPWCRGAGERQLLQLEFQEVAPGGVPSRQTRLV